MTDTTKKSSNRVDITHEGKFHASRNGRVVFENGRIKRFGTEKRLGNFSLAVIWLVKLYIRPLKN